MKIKKFTFGPFQENTYVLYDDSNQCVIIDPGCYEAGEQNELYSFIKNSALSPVILLNTHCHLDHISGNAFVFEKFQLRPWVHSAEIPILNMQEYTSLMYGLQCEKSPAPEKFLSEGVNIEFGNSILEVIFSPGHSPGHVVFFNKAENVLIGGDVLFYNSIGRTDLPMGDHNTLISSIKNKIFPLGDDVRVYSGQGPETTIGHERKNNPYLI
jgi:hydroxyacylglutathione hydrolase